MSSIERSYIPINKVTALVVSKAPLDCQYDAKITCLQRRWENPPPMRALTANIPDFRGKRVGRFTVVGLYAGAPKLWVVRCACGAYETRRAKSLRNPLNIDDCCQLCRHLEHLRWKSARSVNSASRPDPQTSLTQLGLVSRCRPT